MRGKQETVIVIFDDVNENLYELASLVEELGYVARPVHTVAQARRALLLGDATLLLLDIAMPEMSGFDFLQRMRREREWDEIPVVFISAYMDLQTKTEAFGLGAQDYIVRPFEKAECGCRIRQAVYQAELIRQMRLQKADMQQMMEFQGEQMEKTRKLVAEALILMAQEEEPSPGHFKRIQEAAVHFAKGLSVISEYEEIVNDQFIETLNAAAPLYRFGKTPSGREGLHTIHQKEKENRYLTMGMELASGVTEELHQLHGQSLASQIVSLVAWYDLMEGTAEEKMERIKREVESCHNPLLFRAFSIIQLPYYLDKEGEDRVSYK